MNPTDCAFQGEGVRFRYRAGAIILEDDSVLMVKNEREPFYYSVGGAVRLGERAKEAVLRETLEETGVRYEIERLQFIHENFFPCPDALPGEAVRCHEITLYFLMKPRGIKTFADAPPTPEGGVERMVWLPLSEYKNYRAHPAFFGEKLPKRTSRVEHIVTRE